MLESGVVRMLMDVDLYFVFFARVVLAYVSHPRHWKWLVI